MELIEDAKGKDFCKKSSTQAAFFWESLMKGRKPETWMASMTESVLIWSRNYMLYNFSCGNKDGFKSCVLIYKLKLFHYHILIKDT